MYRICKIVLGNPNTYLPLWVSLCLWAGTAHSTDVGSLDSTHLETPHADAYGDLAWPLTLWGHSTT